MLNDLMSATRVEADNNSDTVVGVVVLLCHFYKRIEPGRRTQTIRCASEMLS